MALKNRVLERVPYICLIIKLAVFGNMQMFFNQTTYTNKEQRFAVLGS